MADARGRREHAKRRRLDEAPLLAPATVAAALDVRGAVEVLGVTAREVRALVSSGRLPELLPGHGHFALLDVKRLGIALAGISDPISLKKVAELA